MRIRRHFNADALWARKSVVLDSLIGRFLRRKRPEIRYGLWFSMDAGFRMRRFDVGPCKTLAE